MKIFISQLALWHNEPTGQRQHLIQAQDQGYADQFQSISMLVFFLKWWKMAQELDPSHPFGIYGHSCMLLFWQDPEPSPSPGCQSYLGSDPIGSRNTLSPCLSVFHNLCFLTHKYLKRRNRTLTSSCTPDRGNYQKWRVVKANMDSLSSHPCFSFPVRKKRTLTSIFTKSTSSLIEQRIHLRCLDPRTLQLSQRQALPIRGRCSDSLGETETLS